MARSVRRSYSDKCLEVLSAREEIMALSMGVQLTFAQCFKLASDLQQNNYLLKTSELKSIADYALEHGLAVRDADGLLKWRIG